MPGIGQESHQALVDERASGLVQMQKHKSIGRDHPPAVALNPGCHDKWLSTSARRSPKWRSPSFSMASSAALGKKSQIICVRDAEGCAFHTACGALLLSAHTSPGCMR